MEENEQVITSESSSGNVFAFLGLPDVDHHLEKAQVVVDIYRVMDSKKMSVADVSAVTGVLISDVSNILSGQFKDISIEQLTKMKKDVEQASF